MVNQSYVRYSIACAAMANKQRVCDTSRMLGSSIGFDLIERSINGVPLWMILEDFTNQFTSWITCDSEVNKLCLARTGLPVDCKFNDFLVVQKPYDMFINSNNPDRKNTLQLVLKEMLPNLANPTLSHEFHFVHRLDYATSGIICIALNKRSARAASSAFENRKVKKYYLALLHGHVNDSFIIIDKPIGDDIREKDGNKKMCTSDSFFCIKPRKSCTVLLVLEYGFRKGHTIIGDYTYSERQDVEPHRTFLHSFRLILKNDVENLDIRTADPFLSADPENKWQPTNIVRTLDENIFSEIHELAQ
ncbi:hypothetical protein KPH14_003185 [Odynerus spinipes]|uniref:Pseudouridine synthase RsuA/RluA-like domain-containing protein n=1 Tax=Odynerus spinipes TaxID=1348599 RepID=A0AAD9RYF1_9HYME|nr:hypothetical protein KPH14_003185 [Odynerus spinipes]